MKEYTRKLPNNFEIIEDGNTVKIELRSRKYGIKYGYCDFKYWEYLRQFTWCYIMKSNTTYIRTCYKVNKKDKTSISFGMHNLIMKPPEGFVVNHKDHDGLNNRRSNLEICTNQENSQYRRKKKSNTSGYVGVTKRKNNWEASVEFNNKSFYLGRFNTPIQAAKAYNTKALELFGKFAVLNEIPTQDK